MQQTVKRAKLLSSVWIYFGATLLVGLCIVAFDHVRASERHTSLCDSLLVALQEKSESNSNRIGAYWNCRVQEATAIEYVTNVQHRAAATEWHHTASVLIFFVVISMVVCGLWFSAIQFKRGGAESAPVAESELNVSLKGLKVKSATMGLLILSLSFGFFLVYVIKVYPLRPFFVDFAHESPPSWIDVSAINKLPLPPIPPPRASSSP